MTNSNSAIRLGKLRPRRYEPLVLLTMRKKFFLQVICRKFPNVVGTFDCERRSVPLILGGLDPVRVRARVMTTARRLSSCSYRIVSEQAETGTVTN